MNPIASFANGVVRHRLIVAFGMLAFSLIAIWGYLRDVPPKTDTSLRPRDPQRELLHDVNRQFDLDQAECFLVIDAANLFTSDAVAAIRAVVDSLEQLDHVQSIKWIDDIPTLNVFGLPEPLLPRNDADAESFVEARGRTINHPLVRGQLLSPDGKTLLLPIAFDWIYVKDDADCSSRLLETALRTAADYPEAGLEIQLTGRVPLFLAARQAFNANHRKFQILGYVLVFVLAATLFRGVVAVLIVGIAPALAIFWTGGLLELLALPRNDLTNVVLPVLITMVGLTDGVHLMVYIRRRRAAGDEPAEAVRSAVRHVGTACMLTSLTTAIGFCSLLLAKSEPIRDFGVACSFGVLVTFVAVVTFIPWACSSSLGRSVHKGHEHDFVGNKLERLGGLIDWVMRHARSVSIAGAVLTVVCVWVALSLRPDARTTNALPTNSAATRALAHCNDKFGGIDFVRVVIQWPENIPHEAAEILDTIEDVEALVAEEPLLRHPLSIHNLLASMSNSETDLGARMPFLELMPRELSTVFYNRKTRRTLVMLRVQDLGIAQYQPVFARVEEGLARIEQQHPGFDLQLTGGPVLTGRDLSQIVYDLAASLGTASLVILVVMTVFYRSIRIGLITVIPNVLPLAATGALLVFTGRTLTIVSVCAFTICIGIAVDDTIHFLTRFRQEVASDGNVTAAIRRTFVGVGTALVMTTMILIVGFGSVLISPLPTHRMFSAMACCTIGTALICDLILLPALLSCMIRSSRDVPPETAAAPADDLQDAVPVGAE